MFRKNRMLQPALQVTIGSAFGLSRPCVQQRHFMRIEVIEQGARTLIEHIGIEPVGAQESDASLPLPALGLQTRNLGGELRRLLIEILLGLQPAIAGIGIDAEIGDRARNEGVKAQSRKHGTKASARDHGGNVPPWS
jgi:hypothetical protein